jgi:hypothetical protein
MSTKPLQAFGSPEYKEFVQHIMPRSKELIGKHPDLTPAEMVELDRRIHEAISLMEVARLTLERQIKAAEAIIGPFYLPA